MFTELKKHCAGFHNSCAPPEPLVFEKPRKGPSLVVLVLVVTGSGRGREGGLTVLRLSGIVETSYTEDGGLIRLLRSLSFL